MQFDDWLVRTRTAQRAAHAVLATHEQSASRVILLEDLIRRLVVAPVDVQDYFREAVTCLEQGLNRSGVVLAWKGCQVHWEGQPSRAARSVVGTESMRAPNIISTEHELCDWIRR